MRIAIVAGEASGDLLGADLIREVKTRVPDAIVEGVAGPQMIEAGCEPIYPSEKLAVMGLVEVLKHLREILKIRKSLIAHWLQNPPDVFIGIDAPDFNFVLERALKENSIPTVHYVSPSVWAWRSSRVKKIGRSTDLMLTLFPFEADIYRKEGIKVEFVGHPLAEIVAESSDSLSAREKLALPLDKKVVALLPGSRRSEISRLSAPFIDAAQWALEKDPSLHFVVPLINSTARTAFEEALQRVGSDALPITLVDKQSREAMAAADVILLASGTATLEALLLKKPMVVAYKMSELSYQIISRMLTVPYYSLPNNLAGEGLVKEFTQREVTASNLGEEMLSLLNDIGRRDNLIERFSEIHRQLKQNASQRAADAILGLIK